MQVAAIGNAKAALCWFLTDSKKYWDCAGFLRLLLTDSLKKILRALFKGLMYFRLLPDFPVINFKLIM